jgi:hypothetical protein
MKFTSSAVNLNKCAISDSTKPQTKYDKPQLIRNMSQGGLRGLSIKYDPSSYLVQQQVGEGRAEAKGRKT